jgi:hypothetical protein
MLTAEKKAGWAVSGAMHAAVLGLVLFGADWFADREPRPLNVTSVELIDGSQFDAALSTAPVVRNEGPSELSPPSDAQAEPVETAQADAGVTAPPMPLLARPEKPSDRQPDLQNVLIPPPPTPVPTEAPRPSIARIPTPETLPRQAAEPESPPATEPLQPLASAPAPEPAPAPAPPPEPEPVAAETPVPQPEEPKQEPEPEAVAEAQPEAPVAAAPQEARLPVAKPAKLAAAARASSAPEPVAAAPQPAEVKKPEPEKPAEQAKAEAPEPARPAGGSTSQFAASITAGEKDALRLGIKRFFVYNGNRSDRALQVTIAIELGPDARILGRPELLRASGGDEGARQALFQAGRRALIKAENAGEFAKLPPNKYEGWRVIHVTFTPEEIGFSS